jgi:hypothetical protein
MKNPAIIAVIIIGVCIVVTRITLQSACQAQIETGTTLYAPF